MHECGTVTTPVFLCADAEASSLLHPSLVSLLSFGIVQQETTSYSASNPGFSQFVISSLNHQYISLTAILCTFFMILFNGTLLKQSIQNILVFDILIDLFYFY